MSCHVLFIGGCIYIIIGQRMSLCPDLLNMRIKGRSIFLFLFSFLFFFFFTLLYILPIYVQVVKAIFSDAPPHRQLAF